MGLARAAPLASLVTGAHAEQKVLGRQRPGPLLPDVEEKRSNPLHSFKIYIYFQSYLLLFRKIRKLKNQMMYKVSIQLTQYIS